MVIDFVNVRASHRMRHAHPFWSPWLRPQVEVWLNRVLDRMCATLRHEIPEAVVTYEEKPREQWIFDYPAQVRAGWTGQL